MIVLEKSILVWNDARSTCNALKGSLTIIYKLRVAVVEAPAVWSCSFRLLALLEAAELSNVSFLVC